jgi:hypothetical protein
MSVLEFAPTGFFQMRNYAITRDGVAVGEVQCNRLRTGAAITIDGASYTAASEGLMNRTFYLEGNGRRLATAAVASAIKGGFTVEAGGRTFTLAGVSAFGRTLALAENASTIGKITRRGLFSRGTTVELPNDLAPELKVFLIWLTILTWQRQVVTGVLIGVVAGAADGR